jgi:hypothetical protein
VHLLPPVDFSLRDDFDFEAGIVSGSLLQLGIHLLHFGQQITHCQLDLVCHTMASDNACEPQQGRGEKEELVVWLASGVQLADKKASFREIRERRQREGVHEAVAQLER